MQMNEGGQLRLCLSENGQYGKTDVFKARIQKDEEKIVLLVVRTIESIIKNEQEEMLTRFNALRLLKDCVDMNKVSFNC